MSNDRSNLSLVIVAGVEARVASAQWSNEILSATSRLADQLGGKLRVRFEDPGVTSHEALAFIERCESVGMRPRSVELLPGAESARRALLVAGYRLQVVVTFGVDVSTASDLLDLAMTDGIALSIRVAPGALVEFDEVATALSPSVLQRVQIRPELELPWDPSQAMYFSQICARAQRRIVGSCDDPSLLFLLSPFFVGQGKRIELAVMASGTVFPTIQMAEMFDADCWALGNVFEGERIRERATDWATPGGKHFCVQCILLLTCEESQCRHSLRLMGSRETPTAMGCYAHQRILLDTLGIGDTMAEAGEPKRTEQLVVDGRGGIYRVPVELLEQYKVGTHLVLPPGEDWAPSPVAPPTARRSTRLRVLVDGNEVDL